MSSLPTLLPNKAPTEGRNCYRYRFVFFVCRADMLFRGGRKVMIAGEKSNDGGGESVRFFTLTVMVSFFNMFLCLSHAF